MALIDQRLDEKAVDEKSLMHWLNNQLRPVVRRMRDVVNARAGGYYAETFGDGAATSFVITHGLGSLDVHVQVYTVSSGADVTEIFWPTIGGNIFRTGVDTLQLDCGFGVPAVDELRVVVRL